MPYIPHTNNDIQAMLDEIGISDTHELFNEIPAKLIDSKLSCIPAGINEMMMFKEAVSQADLNNNGLCFIGAGSYEHYIPAAVWDIASRGEFLTAYTPYQAEASQGTLQLLYEFQTMIAELTGMDVANASMYDGASALAEAILMAIRISKRHQATRVLVVGTLNPFYLETIKTITHNQSIEIICLTFDQSTGITPLSAVTGYNSADICALIIAQPNFFGCLEDVDSLTDWGYEQQVTVIACVNPMSLALLKPPGDWGTHGADIVCGEGQPLGVPMASGGPYFGFFSTRLAYVRQMPGRLVGRTVDKTGQVGFTLTLQAREQHIRRAKATSNICTNQGLLVTAATIYMSLLGPTGLLTTAQQCHHHTMQLTQRLTAITGVEQVFSSHFFHEVLLKFDYDLAPILALLAKSGIQGGYAVSPHYPALKNTLLVCATEMRTQDDIDYYVHTLEKIIANL